MEVITLETAAFWRIIHEAVQRCQKPEEKERWLKESETMLLLGIKSKSTLWKLRSEGRIRYTQPLKKVILYDRKSIEELLEDSAKNTF